MDKCYVFSATIGAFVNVVVNTLLIPRYGSVGAGIGTTLAEFSVCFYQTYSVRKNINVKKLIEKGYLKRGKTSNHLLELQVPNEFETKSDDVVTVPLLGKVTAGNPIEAIEVPNEVITLPAYLLPKRKEVFTIKVEGDSMINAGILDKDIVIVERCKTAKNGDIVVAMDEENQVTIKRFFRENDYLSLIHI